MKITNTYLAFLWFQNGPTENRLLTRIYETENGYHFHETKNSGFMQISKEEFEKAIIYTEEIMPTSFVKYSQPRPIE